MTTRSNVSWGAFSLHSAKEWSTHPMSPGVYSLYTAQCYRVVNTPNESWGVFSLYNAME